MEETISDVFTLFFSFLFGEIIANTAVSADAIMHYSAVIVG